MFTQTWKKYLPVIAILLKRSASAEQTLSLNHTDFERATGGRKIKFSFSQLQLNKGRINLAIKQAAVAKELAELLREDALTKKIIAGQYLEFALNNNFQLSIKNNTPLAEVALEAESE
ncbi:hypothetical protein [Agriterribacter sp.]|uniref:hypothetical protein n=1 Tax=Agriterribacter sp. TaxID=2821509 RepID=UPI002B88FB91|nr:hypothetical protein [Agriterribacter sp.]HRO45449.1 hypothetical protein [Agriterribacter sp.]HRQ19166.1 hypothetical protein [Agriterribacter sp.]